MDVKYFIAACLLGLAVLVHEFGHYAAARWARIPIRVFSVGFGPKLWSRKIGNTEYRLSLIPFGGYVLPEAELPEDYFAFSTGRRILMTLGGPAASALLPLLCLSVFNITKIGLSLYGTFVLPWQQAFQLAISMISSIPEMFSKPDQMAGVVGIVIEGGHLVGADFGNGLLFLALISLNFLILNLLPIPALDGGKIILYLLELIHPIFLRLHLPLAIAGWVLIAGLTGYALFVDFNRYWV